MTDKEKAKAYDEALKDMRVIYPNLRGDAKLAVEHAFPELRESEDEKVRKNIIHILQVGGYMSPEEKEEAIAYLEKQKEQEHICDSAQYEEGFKTGLEIGLRKQKEQKPSIFPPGLGKVRWNPISSVQQKPNFIPKIIRPKFAVGDTVCRNMWSNHTIREIYIDCDDPVYVCVNEEGTESHISFSEQDEWERKEQKSINNSTREKIISRATSEKQVVLLSESNGNAEIGWDTRSLEDAKKLLEYGIAFINERLGTNPTGWSKEDEEHIQNCLKVIKMKLDEKPYPYYKDYLWLKSLSERLNLQPKQEWNEEDERKYQCIRSILLTDMNKKVGSWKYSEILEWYEKRGINRYTNSESHWKPNEEQMKALSWLVEYVNPSDKYIVLIKDLYDDLKKLM